MSSGTCSTEYDVSLYGGVDAHLSIADTCLHVSSLTGINCSM